MKFSEKYELLESVTKGQVRTFLGRDVASKARVVVHVFDCPGNHSGQMAGQWVLQAFRNLAPSPLGQVLEVGSYEDSSYAYIVTKPPDAAALQAWVRAYKMHCGSTEDLSREPKPKNSDITTGSLDVNDVRNALAEAAPEVHPAPEAAQAPGEFTKAFWDLAGKPAPQSGSGKSAGTPPASIVAPASMVGSSSAEETRLRAHAGSVPTAEIPSSQQKDGSPDEGFTEAFMKLGDASLSSPNMQVDSVPVPDRPPRAPVPDVLTEKPQAVPRLQRSARPEPGAFTKEFLSVLEAEPRGGRSSESLIPEVPNDVPKQRSPGAFTREFLMVTEGGQQGSTEISPSAAQAPLASRVPTAAENSFEERSPGDAGFTNLFQTAPAESKRQPADAPIPGNKAATGEFTSFFGGPFQAPVESQVPVSFPDPLQSIPQKQEAGDFTRMFGSLKSEKEKLESSPGSGGLRPSSLEKEDYVAPALERAEPPPPSGYGVLSFARKSVMAPPDGARAKAEPWGGSALPKPAEMPPKEPIFPSGEATLGRRSAPAGATQVFVPRGGDAESIAPVEKSGPGEFTRIISGGAPAQNLPAEAPIGAPSAEPRHFGMPSMLQVPGMAPPQMPPMQASQMPGMPSPQMPAFSMPQIQPPQIPPVPKPQGPSGGKMSYLPLIIIFNVLFIVAVLVVLYFAFKH